MNQAHPGSMGKSGLTGTAGQLSLCSQSGQVRVAGLPGGEVAAKETGREDLVAEFRGLIQPVEFHSNNPPLKLFHIPWSLI